MVSVANQRAALPSPARTMVSVANQRASLPSPARTMVSVANQRASLPSPARTMISVANHGWSDSQTRLHRATCLCRGALLPSVLLPSFGYREQCRHVYHPHKPHRGGPLSVSVVERGVCLPGFLSYLCV